MRKTILWLLALALVLGGCAYIPAPPGTTTGPAAPTATAAPTVPAQPPDYAAAFTLENGERTTVLDPGGHVLFQSPAANCAVIRDAFTGEARYIQTAQAPQEGYTWNDYSLYRMDGTPVWESQPQWVSYAADELVIVRDADTGEMALKNPQTGEILRDGFQGAEQVGDCFLLSRWDANVWQIIDARGQLLGERTGAEGDYLYAVGREAPLLVAWTEAGSAQVLNLQFQPVTDQTYEYVQRLGEYLYLQRTDGSWEVMDPATLETVFSCPEEVRFYNGRCAVIRDGIDYYLTDQDGNKRTEGYAAIYSIFDYCYDLLQASPEHPLFLASDYLSREYLLDENGNVLYAVPDGGNLHFLDSQHLLLQEENRATLLDAQGKILPTDEKYTTIYYQDGCLLAAFSPSPGVYLLDLLDGDRNVLLSNLRNVQQIQDQAVVCVRGFDAGLLGLDGQWIYRESIFNSMADD